MEETKQIVVSSNRTVVFNGKIFKCSIGNGGVSNDKREGDGATPAGCFTIRKVFYRSDRIEKINTTIPTQILSKDDGWCDDVKDLNYNKYVKLPYLASHENLWRDDNVYDIIVVLGYNDNPVIVCKGSAIFMHIAREDYSPTAGCIALSRPDLISLLEDISKNTSICVIN